MKLFRNSKSKIRQPGFRNKTESKSERRVFSYHISDERRNIATKQSDNYQNAGRRPAKQAFWHKLPSYLVIASIIVSAGFFLSIDTNPKIVTLESRSDSSLLREKQAYQIEAQKILSKSLLNRSKVTIDTTNFNNQMKLKFPELSEVSVILPLAGRRPIVEVTAKHPVLVLKTGYTQYLLDSRGTAIMNKAEAIGIDSFKLLAVTDQNTNKVSIGKRALTENDVVFITTVVEQLSSKQISLDSAELPQIPAELHVRIKGQSYYVKFNLYGDGKVQAGAFLAVKQKLDTDNISPAEYVDVRIEERVFYK